MSARWTWKCSNCNYTIETTCYWEFYRDEKGELHPYGHPAPISEKARKHGIKGFCDSGYCSKCIEVKDAITQEFDRGIDYWGDRGGPVTRIRSSEALCEECGTKLKVLIGNNELCPKCGNGYFEQFGFMAKS